MKSKILKLKYELLVSLYIEAFEQKHDIEFDYWVADEVGETAVFGDYYFNFNDIRKDIDNNVPDGKIFAWYDETLNEAMDGKSTTNFRTYLKR